MWIVRGGGWTETVNMVSIKLGCFRTCDCSKSSFAVVEFVEFRDQCFNYFQFAKKCGLFCFKIELTYN